MDNMAYRVYIDWDNDGSVLAGTYETGEDVTHRVLGTRTAPSWSFGRDTARSLSAVKPGQISLELNNSSKDYSPDNSSSALYGSLGPGKPVKMTATHYTYYDSFNRADSATLGTSDSGHTWVAGVGATTDASVSGGQLLHASSGPILGFDTGNADFIAEVTIINPDVAQYSGLCVRNTAGGYNAWYLRPYPSPLRYVAESFGGGPGGIYIGGTPRAGDVLRAEGAGNELRFYVNGELVASTTSTYQNTATFHGIHLSNGGTSIGAGRFDDFKLAVPADTTPIFWGFIDDYTIDPHREKKSVTLTCVDALARLAQTQVSTDAYPSLQTGAAIGYVLDAAGWPSTQRDLDTGSTTVRYWCADQVDAWSAIQELVLAEGNPAIAYVDASGNFVFRDRQHRKLRAASITSQATFSDTGSEPLFSEPVEYNIGFRDLINTVDYKVEERAPGALGVVWSTDSTYAIAAGDTVDIIARTSDPFLDAITPEEGTDYQLLSGAVTVNLSRTSGQAVTISVTATSAAYISGMALRAFSCPVAREFNATSVNSASVSKYGITHPESEFQPKWLGVPDAQAIGDRIVAQRGERLPVMSVTIKGANETRKAQILARQLSDLVTIVESETSTNHAHYIEKIEHRVDDVGKLHSVSYGCERAPTVGTQFTLDVAGAGFDQGSFGLSGYNDAANIFILDDSTSGHRLGTGKLAT